MWLSWQSGRFEHQSSAVRIQSTATFIEPIFPVNCSYKKTKIKNKRPGNAQDKSKVKEA